MRISYPVICLLFTTQASFAATSPYLDCIAAIPKEPLGKTVQKMLDNSRKFREAVEHCQNTYIVKRSSSDETSPTDSTIEMEIFKAKEDYNFDVQRINREYNLRRSGLLP